MEISASALTGAMRVGLQIVSTYRQPHLEVYYEVLNQFGPEQEFKLPSIQRDGPADNHKTRFQDLRVQFLLINIGGQRAENVRLTKSGSFERSAGRTFGGLFERTLPQIAPGQVLQLFLLDVHELAWPHKEDIDVSAKDRDLIITASYDSPWGILNAAKTGYARVRGKPHHTTEFRFFPQLVWGDLPPARYA